MALNGLILVAFKGFFLTPMDERDVAEVQSSQGRFQHTVGTKLLPSPVPS